MPVKPWTTNNILLTVGQRYDVIITANQDAGVYWFRTNAVTACASLQSKPDALSIFAYADAPDPDAIPTSSAGDLPSDCNEPANSNLVPWVKNTVDQTAFMNQVKSLNVDLTRTVSSNGQNIVLWSVNMTAMDINWAQPTLSYVAEKNASYPSTYNLLELPTSNIVRIPHSSHLTP